MGFLLGAYGKLMAGNRLRSAQARLMSITRQIQKAARQAANVEKMINNYSRNMQYQMQMYTNAMGYGVDYQLSMGTQKLRDSIFDGITDPNSDEYKSANIKFTNDYTALQMWASQQKQAQSMQAAQFKNYMEEMIDNMKETQLQPLKDLEEDLEQEKAQLETEIKMAEGQKEACEKMEDSGVKAIVPRYTGQG